MSQPWMGVVADDITGSNDIGIMFAKHGCQTHIYNFSVSKPFKLPAVPGTPEVCILNTNSRLDPPELAYQKVWQATRTLQQAGYNHFFNKTCSVFRGNIGPEFDAMLDALEQEFAVVVLGFPKNGRTTVDGIHYVHGKRLEESEFRLDPIHPMTRSNLVEILQSQTRRSVSSIRTPWIQGGPAILRLKVEACRLTGLNYIILDVPNQTALGTIAEALKDDWVLCGSSALAEELPKVCGINPDRQFTLDLPNQTGLGLLCVAGSLMPQTQAQIQYLIEAGAVAFQLDARLLFDDVTRRQEIEHLVDQVSRSIVIGQDTLLQAPLRPEEVQATRAEGARLGLDKTAVGRAVSEALAEVTARVVSNCGINRLVVAGGETSDTVCRHLNIDGLQVWKEIQPGVPSCLTLNDQPMLLVLKSGSFGSPDFLVQAFHHLKG